MAEEYVIHIGVKRENIDRIQRLFPMNTSYEWDGWNAWGEKPGADVNDADTYHVVIGTFGGPLLAESIADYLIDNWPGILVPMGGPDHQAGTRVSITDAFVWSEEAWNIH